MRAPPRRASVFLAFPAASLAAQASALVLRDDPRLPLFEHLVIRGDIRRSVTDVAAGKRRQVDGID